MRKWFRCLFCCCGSSTKVKDETRVSMSRIHSSQLNALQITHNGDITRMGDVTFESVRKKKLARINSTFVAEEVSVADFKVRESKELRYNCPICFRFFDKILVTSCCRNYICHHCANQMNEKTIKDFKNDATTCPFCGNQEFELSDVNPDEKVKRYTDSPSSTFGGGKPFLPKEFDIAPAAKGMEDIEIEARQTPELTKDNKRIKSLPGNKKYAFVQKARRSSDGMLSIKGILQDITQGLPVVDLTQEDMQTARFRSNTEEGTREKPDGDKSKDEILIQPNFRVSRSFSEAVI